MNDILTVTLNPALDMSSTVAALVAGDKLRCEAPVYDPGGGGINVARAVGLLGGRATAFVAVAGYRGEQLCDLLRLEGVPLVPFQVAGETRESLAVIDRTDAKQYRFSCPARPGMPAWPRPPFWPLPTNWTGAGFWFCPAHSQAGCPTGFPPIWPPLPAAAIAG